MDAQWNTNEKTEKYPYIPEPGEIKTDALGLTYESYHGYSIYPYFYGGYCISDKGNDICSKTDRPKDLIEARLFCDKYAGIYQQKIEELGVYKGDDGLWHSNEEQERGI